MFNFLFNCLHPTKATLLQQAQHSGSECDHQISSIAKNPASRAWRARGSTEKIVGWAADAKGHRKVSNIARAHHPQVGNQDEDAYIPWVRSPPHGQAVPRGFRAQRARHPQPLGVFLKKWDWTPCGSSLRCPRWLAMIFNARCAPSSTTSQRTWAVRWRRSTSARGASRRVWRNASSRGTSTWNCTEEDKTTAWALSVV